MLVSNTLFEKVASLKIYHFQNIYILYIIYIYIFFHPSKIKNVSKLIETVPNLINNNLSTTSCKMFYLFINLFSRRYKNIKSSILIKIGIKCLSISIYELRPSKHLPIQSQDQNYQNKELNTINNRIRSQSSIKHPVKNAPLLWGKISYKRLRPFKSLIKTEGLFKQKEKWIIVINLGRNFGRNFPIL